MNEIQQISCFLKIFYCLCYYSCLNFFLIAPFHLACLPRYHSQTPPCCSSPWVLHVCPLTYPFAFFHSVPACKLLFGLLRIVCKCQSKIFGYLLLLLL